MLVPVDVSLENVMVLGIVRLLEVVYTSESVLLDMDNVDDETGEMNVELTSL